MNIGFSLSNIAGQQNKLYVLNEKGHYMLNKYKFPKDWSKLTAQEILENVQYLQRHHRKYKITKIDDKTIKIGDVSIYKDLIFTKYCTTHFATINGATISADKHPQLYAAINDLWHVCGRASTPLKQRVQNRMRDWWQDNRDVTIVASSAVAIVTAFVLMFACAKNRAAKEQERAQQEQEKAVQELQDRIKRSLQKPETQQIMNQTYFYANDSLKQHTR